MSGGSFPADDCNAVIQIRASTLFVVGAKGVFVAIISPTLAFGIPMRVVCCFCTCIAGVRVSAIPAILLGVRVGTTGLLPAQSK